MIYLKRDLFVIYQQCKGACCVEGEAGAPLEEGELKELEKNFRGHSSLISMTKALG